MWRLTTLGGLGLEGVERACPDGGAAVAAPVAVAQRRPLALLAVLAAGGERPTSRDELLLYFWPDSDVERARNALRQTLFRLRRDLGPGDPIIGNTELRLDPGVVTTDVAEFEGALARGDLERAVDLYRGPFLQGVSVGANPEFNRWAAKERARLAARFCTAVESLARTAETQGDYEAAIAWWRRLAAIDPTNPHVAVGLMTALAATGDHDGALQYYRLHEVLLQEEIGVSADETLTALVSRLRGDVSAAKSKEVGAPAHSSPTAEETAALPDRSHLIGAPRSRRGAQLMALRVSIAAAVVVAIAVALSHGSIGGDARAAAAVSSDVIAVFPFATRGDNGAEGLGMAVSDLLSSALDGAGALRVADRRVLNQGIDAGRGLPSDPGGAQTVAARHGAGRLVLGEVTATGTRLAITASVYAHGGAPTPVAALSVTGERDDIAAVTQELARRLLAASHEGPAGRLTRSAALTTRSLSALRAYLDGEHRFQNGQFGPALEAFQRAVAEDTSFALAYYRLSIVADWASHPTLPTEALGNALSRAHRLPEHDQRLVRALAAWRHGRGAEAMQLYRIAVSQYPDDVEAWYQLGEVLYHAGPAYGQSVLEARPAFERALQFRPGARESLVHLIRLAAKAKDAAAVDSLTRRVIAMDTTKDASELRLFRALVVGDRDSIARLVEPLRASPDEAVLSAAWRAGVFAEDLGGATAIARLLIDPSRTVVYQATGRWYVASLELAGGRWNSARAMLGPAIATWSDPNGASLADPNAAVAGLAGMDAGSIDAVHAGQLGLMAALPVLSLSPNELTIIRRRVMAWPEPVSPELVYWPNAFDPKLRDYILGLLSVRAGDTAAALRHAVRLDRLQREPGVAEAARGAALTLRAEVARSAGKREEALALLDAAPIDASLSNVVASRAYERFLRAELLRELGRDDEALRWYATQGQSIVPDMIYLAPAELRQAQIHERRGDRVRALAHYRRFVELWSEADPELQPMVVDARRHVRGLGGD